MVRKTLSTPTPRARPAGLAAGTVGITVASAGLLGLAVVLPFLTKEFDVHPARAALLMPAAYLGSFATSIYGGILADRYGGRRITGLGLVLIAAGVMTAGAAPTFNGYLFGAALAGMGYGIANPATSVLVNSVNLHRRGLQLGIKQAGVTLGGLAAGLTIPPVILLAGRSVALFALSASVVVVAASIVLGGRRAEEKVATKVEAVWEPAALEPVSGAIYGFAMSAAQVSAFGLLAVYLVDRLEMSPAEASVVFGLVLGTGVLARIGWSLLSDWSVRRRAHRSWRGRVLPLRLCAMFGLAGFVAMTIPTRASAVLGALCLGVGATGWNGAYLAAVMPGGGTRGGRTAGRALMLVNAGCAVGPILAGVVLAMTGRWEVMWGLLAVFQILALATARAVSSV